MALIRVTGAATLSLVLVACGAGAPPTAAPTPADTPAATPVQTPAGTECGPDSPHLKNAGQLTLSTDNPAFPPWWGGDPEEEYEGQPDDDAGWEVSNPYSGEGLESATAYAIAERLGFSRDQVVWLQNAVFEQAFAPGPKPFDFHMAQVSIRPERAEAVDFSDPYFDSHQSLLTLTGNDIADETTVSGLQEYRLGAAAATTSYQLIEDVIQPTVEPSVFPDNATALTALQNGQIDGLVVDLGTAFYMRDAQLEDWDTPDPEGTIVGAFPESAQTDQVGAVLELDSPFTECVNQALSELRAEGTLDEIFEENIGQQLGVSFFEP
ncbi:MAG TPA: transporter substrate-binding domain-containing protein [Candidatus Limnocylindrales bacterium]|nr:transporter substrate-binding domain-containing protein [Candidatus Limnocylindrales bacterium]